MTILDYLLDGLEAELALERELGVRSVEIDRALLSAPAEGARVQGGKGSREQGLKGTGAQGIKAALAPSTAAQPPGTATKSPTYDFVFLHDKELSAKGAEDMAKIIAAMGKTLETAPIILAPPVPPAKVYVVLGGRALKKWFPGTNVAPGQWFTSAKGRDVLVTYTPEYFLRFTTITPAVKKLKQDMWTSLKGLMKRVVLSS